MHVATDQHMPAHFSGMQVCFDGAEVQHAIQFHNHQRMAHACLLYASVTNSCAQALPSETTANAASKHKSKRKLQHLPGLTALWQMRGKAKDSSNSEVLCVSHHAHVGKRKFLSRSPSHGAIQSVTSLQCWSLARTQLKIWYTSVSPCKTQCEACLQFQSYRQSAETQAHILPRSFSQVNQH